MGATVPCRRGQNPMPRKKPARKRDPARSRRVLRPDYLIADGKRRKDKRDWLSVMGEGHPESKRPRKEDAL
jgi:hypothetical protein